MSSCEVLALRHLLGDLLATGVTGLACLRGQLLQRLTLLLDDLAQLVGDVVVHAAEVVLLQALLALAAQVLEHLAEALDAIAVGRLEPLLEHAPQGGVDVAVVEQVVGELAEDLVGAELEARSGCRPSASTGTGGPAAPCASCPTPSAAPSWCDQPPRRYRTSRPKRTALSFPPRDPVGCHRCAHRERDHPGGGRTVLAPAHRPRAAAHPAARPTGRGRRAGPSRATTSSTTAPCPSPSSSGSRAGGPATSWSAPPPRTAPSAPSTTASPPSDGTPPARFTCVITDLGGSWPRLVVQPRERGARWPSLDVALLDRLEPIDAHDGFRAWTDDLFFAQTLPRQPARRLAGPAVAERPVRDLRRPAPRLVPPTLAPQAPRRAARQRCALLPHPRRGLGPLPRRQARRGGLSIPT